MYKMMQQYQENYVQSVVTKPGELRTVYKGKLYESVATIPGELCTK